MRLSKLLVLITVVSLCGCTANTLRVGAGALLLADWQQTRNIDTNRFYENNILLGKSPSQQKVDLYFGAVTLGLLLLDRKIPERWRKRMWLSVLAVEGYAVGSNLAIGVSF